jgi:hypothetical protein
MEIYENAWQEAMRRFNYGWRPDKLLGSENVKLLKAEKMNWRGLGLSLAPADISGWEVCGSRSPECTKYCLFETGRGSRNMTRHDGSNPIWMGRIFRTIWFFKARKEFMNRLIHEIDQNQDAAIRLNVFSDWQWERQTPNIFDLFPDTQFYDYTKHFKRMFRARSKNYHLTFSLHENNQNQAHQVLEAGYNVAAVLKGLPQTLFNHPVIDGDEHDLRFLDPSPVVVGLRPKGLLKTSTTEFIHVPEAA